MVAYFVRFIKSKYFPLICIVVLFISLECYFSLLHTFPSIRKETDGIGYMERATAALFQVDPFHGPGYSWAIRLIHFISGLSLFSSAKLVSIISGTIFIILVYAVFSTTDTHRMAWKVSLLTAISPVILQHSVMVMSDMLAAALMWGVIWLLIKNDPPQFKQFLLAGILAGFAYITRYMFIFMIVVPVIYIFIKGWNKKILLDISAFYLGFLFVASPWLVFLWHTKGNPFWNMNYLNIAFKMYHGGKGWNTFPSVERFPSMMAVISSSPILFFKVWAETLIKLPLTTFKLIPVVGLFLGGIGFCVWVFHITVRKIVFLIAFIGYGLLVALVWLEPRFLIAFVPIVALGIIQSIELIPCRMSFKFSDKLFILPIQVLVFYIIICIVAFHSVSNVYTWIKAKQADEYVDCVSWLRSRHGDNTFRVMAAKPHIAFFAGMEYLRFREYDLQTKNMIQLREILKTVHPDYFVYDERYSSVEFPQFSSLLNTNKIPSFLEVIHKFDMPKQLVLFKYTGADAEKRENELL